MNIAGWLPDDPDLRDYSQRHENVAPMLRLTAAIGTDPLPLIVDLREGFSPVEQQGAIGSCTANAAAGVIEFMQRRARAKYIDMSRRFLYKMTRQRMGFMGDTGASLRETLKTLVDVGAPPESLWPYDIRHYDDEIPGEVLSHAFPRRVLTYYTLDPLGQGTDQTLDELRRAVAAGIPVMFGFTVHSNWDQRSAVIPMPSSRDRHVGGHAVVAAGYDDTRDLLLFRNSWGAEWGEGGYGWMPFAYLVHGWAQDFWAVLTQAWVETGAFA